MVLFLSIQQAQLKQVSQPSFILTASDFVSFFTVPSLEVPSTPVRPAYNSHGYSPFDNSKKRKNNSWRNQNQFNNNDGITSNLIDSFNYSSPTISPSTSTSTSAYVSPVNNGRYFSQVRVSIFICCYYL
jgi:hypothetical protein